MTGTAAFVWSDELAAYDFGPSHPLAPVRVELAVRLARDLGLLDGVDVLGPFVAGDDLIGLVHDPTYIEAVKHASATGRAGLRTRPRLPGQPGVRRDARGVGTCRRRNGQAVRAVVGRVPRARRQPRRRSAPRDGRPAPPVSASTTTSRSASLRAASTACSGWPTSTWTSTTATGWSAAFWDDPRVLTISLHESGRTLFPGTGTPRTSGGRAPRAPRSTCALPPGTADAGWLRAFHAVVPALAGGVPARAAGDPAGLRLRIATTRWPIWMLTVDGQRETYGLLHELAHEHAGGRWVATGGGGYAVVDVVPACLGPPGRRRSSGGRWIRATPVPPEWRSYVREPPGREGPSRMGRWRLLSVLPPVLGVLTTIGPTTTPRRGASHPRRDGRGNAGDSERALAEMRFLTVAEVAVEDAVSKMTVYRLVHAGEHACRPGRALLPGTGAGRRTTTSATPSSRPADDLRLTPSAAPAD